MKVGTENSKPVDPQAALHDAMSDIDELEASFTGALAILERDCGAMSPRERFAARQLVSEGIERLRAAGRRLDGEVSIPLNRMGQAALDTMSSQPVAFALAEGTQVDWRSRYDSAVDAATKARSCLRAAYGRIEDGALANEPGQADVQLDRLTDATNLSEAALAQLDVIVDAAAAMGGRHA